MKSFRRYLIVFGCLACLVLGAKPLVHAQDASPIRDVKVPSEDASDKERVDTVRAIEQMLANLVVATRDAIVATVRTDYLKVRNLWLEIGMRIRAGGLKLNNKEERAAKYFEKFREDYVSQFQGYTAKNLNFPPAQPFPLVKAEIEGTKTFQLIQRMPKGGLLHVHSSVCGSAKWIAQNMGRYERCFVCWPSDTSDAKGNRYVKGQLIFRSGDVPNGFVRASTLSAREQAEMERLLMMDGTDFGAQNGLDPWVQFGATFQRIGEFVSELSVFRDYYEAAFRSYLEDGISYVELRCSLIKLADVTGGTTPTPDQFVDEYRAIRDRIRADHPEFDLKLIIASGRVGKNSLTAMDRLKFETLAQRVLELHQQKPDMVIGYDLVGKETMGNQTRNVLDVWLSLKKKLALDAHSELPFYFHDGETDWAENEDVIDAVLLGSRRIGHAFNLVAYPYVESQLEARGIAVEVCPISNQVLRYIRDLRIHPACGYIRRGVPCVLACDDPLIFGNHGLSYDFWEAWIAWDLELHDIKLLAMNSIKYSGMNQAEKVTANTNFEAEWSKFIDSIVAPPRP